MNYLCPLVTFGGPLKRPILRLPSPALFSSQHLLAEHSNCGDTVNPDVNTAFNVASDGVEIADESKE